MSKRKLEAFVEDSDDEDAPAPGRQILPVANLPDSFDGVPTDGLEYLFTVRRDSRKLPSITRVQNPYASLAPILPPSNVILSTSCLPSSEWRSVCETRFRNLRANSTQTSLNVTSPHIKIMPDKKERDLWWAFLSGKPETEWNPPKRPPKKSTSKFGGMRGFPQAFEQDTDVYKVGVSGTDERISSVDEDEMGTSPIPHCGSTNQLLKPRGPNPSLIQAIDEPMALHLLMYFEYWINRHLSDPEMSFQPTESHANWIFSLLSRVDDHISADDMNLLRKLARATIAFLKTVKQVGHIQSEESTMELVNSASGRMSERSCWIILTIIIDGWKQRDLWMDAETALRSSHAS